MELEQRLKDLKSRRVEGIENRELEADILRVRRSITLERELSIVPYGVVRHRDLDDEEWKAEAAIQLAKIKDL